MKNQKTLIQEVIKLINLSSMEDDERQMWFLMAPSMTEEELIKFKAILEKEVNKLTDLYLKLLNKKTAKNK